MSGLYHDLEPGDYAAGEDVERLGRLVELRRKVDAEIVAEVDRLARSGAPWHVIGRVLCKPAFDARRLHMRHLAARAAGQDTA